MDSTQILHFRYISNGPAAMFLSIVKGFIVSTSTGRHTKNSHQLAKSHFSFCVADKPSHPYADLAECARRVSINETCGSIISSKTISPTAFHGLLIYRSPTKKKLYRCFGVICGFCHVVAWRYANVKALERFKSRSLSTRCLLSC